MQARHNHTRVVAETQPDQPSLSAPPSAEPVMIVDNKRWPRAISHTIDLWLLSKYTLTQSKSTAIVYRESITSLHTFLLEQGLDLGRPASEIVGFIQSWANLRTDARKHQGHVSPSTYNQRVAAISSFYQWAIEQGLYQGSNPAKQLNRVPVQKYAKTQAPNPQQIALKLKAIDRSTPRGLRDYTLLQVALNTGRSLQELASLNWGSLHIENETVTLTFLYCRGGKTLYDRLDIRLSQTLLSYLRIIYGERLDTLVPQAPIWVSFSDRNYHQRIGAQTIADICKHHLGFSTVHSLRHTFAIAMEQQGAEASIIQERLGNASATETNRYLARLKKSV